MTGDFSKWYFDRKNNFNGVLHQQGRVLLDSDWNDQTRIINNWQNQAGRDIIGPGVAAIPASEPGALEVKSASRNGSDVNISVNPGRGWVDGLAVCLACDKSNPVEFVATYLQDGEVSPINNGTRDAVILEVWQEAVNGFQLFDMLIEPALGGPDTTERVHTGMAFRLLRLEEGDTCDNIRERLKDDFSKKGKLKVTLQPTTESDDVCPEVKKGGYTGFEHNLYRIEIAEVDDDIPRFKWSQFNGGLVGRGTFDLTNNKVIITANLQAIITSGLSEFYLEALNNDPNSDHWKVIYGAEVTLNSENEIILPDDVDSFFNSSPNGEYFFRLWNGIRAIENFPVKSEPEVEPQELHDGIRREFDNPGEETNYKPGDYWTFPVRAGGIKNHEVLIDLQPPEGIHYHRVPLAILNWGSMNDIDSHRIEDCRDVFRPLTNQTVCCTFLVGEHGDFDSIEEALELLPDSGVEICLLPGLHETNAVIDGKKNIKIRGCGEQTFVRNKHLNDDPIFHVKDSEHITFEHMDIATMHGTAISLEGTLQEIEICHNRIAAINEGIHVDLGVGIKIHNNKIRISDSEGAGVAIFIKAEDSVIERNDIGVVLEESIPPIVFPDREEYLTGPCPDYDKLHDNPILFMRYAYLIWNNIIDIPQAAQFKALGGIQIAGESERIKVLENVIKGGAGNGITLGNVASLPLGSEVDENEQLIIDNKGDSIWCAVLENELYLKDIGLKLIKTDNNKVLQGITDDNGHIFFSEALEGGYKVSITNPGYRIKGYKEVDEEEFNFRHLIYVEKVDIDTSNMAAFIYEIQIDRNEISNMCLSGIGVPRRTLIDSSSSSLFARTTGTPWISAPLFQSQLGNLANNLSIYKNHIFNCLQTTDDLELRAEVTKKGVGGISLGMCEHLSIHRNRIEDNGISHIYPVCGIYVADGEQVDITHNHISNNGPLMSDLGTSKPLENGIRGGIVLTVSSFDNSDSTSQDFFIYIGGHAARVHDNVVNQPAGQALRIIANGPISILNNQFNSVLSGLNYHTIGSKKSFNFDKFAGAVLIYNSGKHFDISAPKNSADRQMPMTTLPAGNILFNSNQTCVGDINKSFFSQLIVSLDDIGFNANQSDNFQNDSLLSNTLLVATTLRASESRFKEIIRSMNDQVLSLLTFAILGNITTNNQGDHCIFALKGISTVDKPNQFLILNCPRNTKAIRNLSTKFLKGVYNDG